jgi:hypothetical protein
LSKAEPTIVRNQWESSTIFIAYKKPGLTFFAGFGFWMRQISYDEHEKHLMIPAQAA